MWDFLIKNANTYILLVAAHRPSDFHYARQIISFMNQRVQIPMLIGLTHMDCPGAFTPEQIMSGLGYLNERNRPSVVIVNPNERVSVVETLMASMALLVAQYSNDQPLQVGQVGQPVRSRDRNNYKVPTPQFSRGY
jgi:signal recognition particle receptor subunit beta